MKKTFVFLCVMCAAVLGTAQTSSVSAVKAPTNELTGPEILKRYRTLEMAVFSMTREEWEIFRAWEGYDERAVIEIIEARKAEYQPTAELLKAARSADECDCWVEPDETYLSVNASDWDECGGAGVDVDCWFGPVFLGGWNFNLYGNNYNSVYINSKGTISFGSGIIDWTPDEFPGATYNQIAGYWADADFRPGGELLYKITPEAAYFNFINVGYFNNHGNLRNTFQIIITPSTGGILNEGNNVQICFQDMAWAHGDVGGSSGFNGPNPGVVGADVSAASGPNIQFGRFNYNNANYNGPYGAAANQQDGIHWLDNKVFEFSTQSANQSNIPPISSASYGCDTLFVCLNDTLPLNVSYLAPETNQQVQITVTGDLNGYEQVSLQNGNTATLQGIFVGSASNIGVHDLVITATDNGNPAGVTVTNLVIEVLDVELPPLTVSGVFGICAGQSTTLTASPGFDSYSWTNGCDGPVCTTNTAGNGIVTANYQGCEATTNYFLDVTPFFNPGVTVTPNPICSDEPATLTVTPPDDDDPAYVSYSWEGDWNGGGGEILSQNGPTATANCGMFRVLVEDELGCFGQNVFPVLCVDPFIPEDTWSGAYCDGFEPVTFSGGYSEPAEGNLTVYLTSSNNAGWNGSYVQVYVNGQPWSPVFTISSTFGQFFVPIEFGDEIEIEYVSAPGTNDALNTIQVFNCGSQGSGTVNMTPGTVWTAMSACNAQPALGAWTYTGPAGGTFTTTTQYNSTFTPAPGAYGLYELCFAEEQCGIDYCYELEYTLPPTIDLLPFDGTLCGNESVTVVADTTDAGGTATINWPNPGTDNVLTNTYSYSTPQTLTSSVSITNGCGTDTAPLNFNVYYPPAAFTLEDEILCDGGSVPFDPLTGANELAGLSYNWTLNGNALSTDDSIEATETGVYCVTISVPQCNFNATDCANVSISAPLVDPFEDFYAECNGVGSATIWVENIPPGAEYDVVWPDGSTGISWDYTSSGTWTVTITDAGDCFTETYEFGTYVGLAPVTDPAPTSLVVLCPEVPNTFSVNATNTLPGTYTWTANCDGGITFSGTNDDIQISSSVFPDECWGQIVTITGVAQNVCGTVSETFEVLIDPCDIIVPNVVTPNGDSFNDSFTIEGLEVYSNVLLTVFNRWGNIVYENTDYQSGEFNANDVADGTYWYQIILPNGREHKGVLTITR